MKAIFKITRLAIFIRASSVFVALFLLALLSGCSRSSGATDIVGSELLLSALPAIGVQGRVIRSLDRNVVMVLPVNAVHGNIGIGIRPISGVPDGNLGLAYGVETVGSGPFALERPATIHISYSEDALPLGVDEADLALGVIVDRRWRELPGVRVDVVSNKVSVGLNSLYPLSIFGIFVRAYPVILNASFDLPVLEGKSMAGWRSVSQSSGAGGIGNLNGNRFFIINSAGQVDSDPAIHQVVSGLSPGRRYTISGLFSGYGDCCGNTMTPSFGVAVDGRIILKRSRPLERGFVPFSATLLATAPSHEISFIAERNGEDVAYAIDDITIVPLRGFSLAVDHKNHNGGTVVSYPDGIDCGESCFANFASGSRVTLIAKQKAGFVFAGFSGGECSSSFTCTITMDAAKTVTATFAYPSENATLIGLSTFSKLGYADERLEPDFRSEILAYKAQRLEPGLITFVASTGDPGAVIQIAGATERSGQPFSLYFNGTDVAVPITITAQDGKSIKSYTVLLCRWYCQGLQNGLKEDTTL